MKKIKELRLANELTLQALSKKSGVAVGYIADLENGKSLNPTLKTLNKLANALGVEVTSLLDTA